MTDDGYPVDPLVECDECHQIRACYDDGDGRKVCVECDDPDWSDNI